MNGALATMLRSHFFILALFLFVFFALAISAQAAVLFQQSDDSVTYTHCTWSGAPVCTGTQDVDNGDMYFFTPSAGTFGSIRFFANTAITDYIKVALKNVTEDGPISVFNFQPNISDGTGSMEEYIVNDVNFTQLMNFDGTDQWYLEMFGFERTHFCFNIYCPRIAEFKGSTTTLLGSSSYTPFFEIKDYGIIRNDYTYSDGLFGGKTYLISGIVTIDPGVTLTIQPGAFIKFDTSTTSGLVVNGNLVALGNIYDPDSSEATGSIFFTSSDDDFKGKDTNGGATSTSGVAGDWAGIQVNPGGSANLGYVTIRYGGSINGSNAMMHNNGGSVFIATSTVIDGSGYGIKNSSGTTTILNTDLAFNDYGLYVAGGSASVSGGSIIHGNETYGVYNSTMSTTSAINNHWAASTTATSTGPYHPSSNPSGNGDKVSDFVDFSGDVESVDYALPFGTSVDSENCRMEYVTFTDYTSELGYSVSTWNALTGVDILATTSTNNANLMITDRELPDKVWNGYWVATSSPGAPDDLVLNSYHLDKNRGDYTKNVILHELGHAMGLNHSFSGNVMYFTVRLMTSLGIQDLADYYDNWGDCSL